MFVAMPGGLARWTDDLDFFPIVPKTRFDPAVPYVAFHHQAEVHLFGIDIKDPLFLNQWRTGEVTGLADKRVHEHRWEVDSLVVYL